MAQPFDPGYVHPPFADLAADFPGADVYPASDFRLEWGPIFHRGRLDGSARVLVLGQDPGAHESASRRILIGEAGQRVQGFLHKLGIQRSYVAVNTFLYSVYGQSGGNQHKDDAGIVAYRNRWLDALLVGSKVEAVIALGGLADDAWQKWKATPSGQGAAAALAYAHVTHPTQPESSSGGDATKLKAAITAMLQNWNTALQALHPKVSHPDTSVPLVLYGASFAAAEKPPIPAGDLPAGSPPWMLDQDGWAKRAGTTPQQKRYSITVTVPTTFQV
jgi:uracil-DNA glycosylase